MNIQSILDKIDSDARDAASALLAEAQERVKSIQAQSDAEIERRFQEMEARVNADAVEAESRITRMAELEEKKKVLAVKREVIDKAFESAAQQLAQLPVERKRAFFEEELKQVAQKGGEIRIGRVDAGWFEDGLLTACGLTRGEDTDGCGFEITVGGAVMKCTFEALLESSRIDLEGDAARLLFQE